MRWYHIVNRKGIIKLKAANPGSAKGITDTTDKVSDHTFITALGLLRVGQDTTGPETEESESKLKNSVESFKRVLRT